LYGIVCVGRAAELGSVLCPV